MRAAPFVVNRGQSSKRDRSGLGSRCWRASSEHHAVEQGGGRQSPSNAQPRAPVPPVGRKMILSWFSRLAKWDAGRLATADPTHTGTRMLRSPIRATRYGGRKSCGSRAPCSAVRGPSGRGLAIDVRDIGLLTSCSRRRLGHNTPRLHQFAPLL
jgi:hypothetical protein